MPQRPGRRLGHHGQAAARIGYRVIACFYRVQHRAARHHVIHQLVGGDAKAVQRNALPADVGNVKLLQQRGYLTLGNRRKKPHVVQTLSLNTLRQARLFVPVANQHKRNIFMLQQSSCIQQNIQRIGHAMRARVAHHHAPGRPQ